MPTKNPILTESYQRAADGPQNVTISVNNGAGEWAVEESQTAPGTIGQWLGQKPESMALEAGQSLFVKGHGTLVLTDGGSAITGQRIERNAAGAGWLALAPVAPAATSHTDTTAVNGTSYQYRIIADNIAGASAASNIGSATPTAGDIVAPVITLPTWDDATRVMSCTVSEPCNLIICTVAPGVTPVPNGSGGWSNATVQTLVEAVTGTNTVVLPALNETADRVAYYARDAAGNDSIELIINAMTFAAAGSLTYHSSANQSLILNTGEIDATFATAFTGAGTFIVAIGTVGTGHANWAITGSNITSTTGIARSTAGNSDTGWPTSRS